MVWVAGGLRFSAPGSLALREARQGDDRGRRRGDSRRAASPTDTASRTARSRSPRPTRTPKALRGAGVEPDQAVRRADDRARGSPRSASSARTRACSARSSTSIEMRRPSSRAASTSGSSQLPERVVTTAMQSHQRYFPLGGNRFAFVANGGDPELVRAGTSACSTAGSRTRRSPSSATSPTGSRGWPASSARSRSSPARARSPTRRSGSWRSSRRSAGETRRSEAARLAKADQAAELVREFPDLEGHIGAEYARLAGFPEAVCMAIEEQYLPDAADGPLPHTEAGRVAGRRGQDRQPHRRLRARKAADRLARPVRSAPRGDRPLPPRRRGRARDRREGARRPRPRAPRRARAPP